MLEPIAKINWVIPVRCLDYNRMSASVWVRCLQLIPFLDQRGIRSEINNIETVAPVVIFVRNQSEESWELAKRFHSEGKKIVFDLCVNYFDRSDLKNLGSPVHERHIKECLKMVDVADCITCASANIAERALDFHHNVHYIPDSINIEHFSYRKAPADFLAPRLRAVWSGQAQKALELVPILKLIRRRKIPIKLITNEKIRLSTGIGIVGYKYEFCLWRYEDFPRNIIEGEICLSYREIETAYNRGHSFFKIGTFLAEGVPCLASPVPSYCELLEDGVCGRICSELKEWEEALDLVLDDRSVLQRWSVEAALKMREYSTARIAEKYIEMFQSLEAC